MARGLQIIRLGVRQLARHRRPRHTSEQLGLQKVGHLLIGGSPREETPGLADVAVISSEVIQDHQQRRVRIAPVMGPHEGERVGGGPTVRGQSPRFFSGLEEAVETVLRGDQRRTGKPGVLPHPLAQAQRMPRIQAGGRRAIGVERAAGGDCVAEPRTHLNRPRQIPLPSRPT